MITLWKRTNELNNIDEQTIQLFSVQDKIVFFKLLNTIPSPIRRNVKLRGDYCIILPFFELEHTTSFP